MPRPTEGGGSTTGEGPDGAHAGAPASTGGSPAVIDTPPAQRPSSAARSRRGGPARRLDGVDVARAVAILGMVTVHFGPLPITESGAAAWLYGSLYGKASVLFVVVAGMGVALMGEGRRPRGVLRARLVYRTIWLLPLGLWLQELDHPVAVILQYYALYFLFLAPFVGRRDRTVVSWAAGLLVAGAAAVLAAQVLAPEWVVPLGGSSPYGVPGDLVLFGYYPLVTWLPPMLFGLWLGRRNLSASRVRATMIVGGAAALAATTAAGRGLARLAGGAPPEDSWWWAISVEGHSEMPLAIVGATGFATAVVGLGLVLADRWPPLLWPLAALGRLALSVYVGHLIVFHLVPDLFPADDVMEGIRTILAFGAVTALLSMAWLTLARRGPLEATVRWPWRHLIEPYVAKRAAARPVTLPRRKA